MKKFFFLLCFVTLLPALAFAQFSEDTDRKIDSLNRVIAEARHDTLVADAYLGQSMLWAGSNLDTVIWFCEKAKKIAERQLTQNRLSFVEIAAYRDLLNSALVNIGWVHVFRQNTRLALEYFLEGIPYFKIQGQEIHLSNTLSSIGALYRQLGDYPKALQYYQNSLNLREKISDKKGIGQVHFNIGVIYLARQEIQKARKMFKLASTTFEEFENNKHLALAIDHIGKCLIQEEKYDEARTYFNKGLALREEIGDSTGIALSYLNYAQLIFKQNSNLKEAVDLTQKAISIFKLKKDRRNLSDAYRALSSFYLQSKNYSKAISSGELSLKFAQEQGNTNLLKNSSKTLYDCYKASKDYRKALLMHELYIEMRDSISNKENTRALVTSELQYKYEKEKQADQLELAELQYQAKLRQQRKDQITYAGFGGLLTFGLLGFLGVRNRQRKKELQRQKALNEQLQHLDKLKDQFLANTSHELRTPLNGIVGLSESLFEGAAGPGSEKMKQDLSMIISSGKRLSALINDILDFSKLRENDISLATKAIDLHMAVEVSMRILYPSTLGKKIELINDIPTTFSAVTADESRLQQILLNLIGNAIKFTNQGSIRVTAQRVNEEIYITVKDSGIGIPKDKLKDIFKDFQQSDASIERQYGGTGLGLNITKHLVTLHGGELTVESEEAKGSSFSFNLPASVAPALQKEMGVGIARIKMMSELTGEIGINVNVNDPSGIQILIVDDEPINRQVLANYLQHSNFSISHASNGQEAMEMIGIKKFDLILLDIMMPGMSGYVVCQEIRKLFSNSELPVIMVTAKDQVTDLIQGFNLGANDYLVKPISKGELLSRVKTHLNLSKINKSYRRFIPQEFLKSLGKEDILDVRLGDQVQDDVTIMFSDIRFYTTLSESMTVAENFKFLNAYLGRIGPVIQNNNGYINQFLGDGIMALFQNEPEAALKAAIEIQHVLKDYNIQRIKQNRHPLSIGTGLHYGSLMLGIIGDEKRMDAGVVSDTVNTASRVEGLTKYYGASIVISEDTIRHIPEVEKYHYRYLGRVLLIGKKDPLSVYEFFGGDGAKSVELKEATKSEFENGLSAYFNRDFTDAASYFKHVVDKDNSDLAAQIYLQNCATFMVQGVSEDWAGIQEMSFK